MARKQPSTAFSTLERSDLQHLFDALAGQGYRLLGPVAAEGAIVYREIGSVDELPIGWSDAQEAGTYRLQKTGGETLFGHSLGPDSWKRFLHPPALRLWSAARTDVGFEIIPEPVSAPKQAFIGVRACELSAIAIQDRVFLGGPYVDPGYAARRANTVLIAVNCGQAAATCFCASMQTGPKCAAGFDLALTEVEAAERHYFVVEAGSDKGRALLGEVPHRAASEDEICAAEAVVARAAGQVQRRVETHGLKEALYAASASPRWEEVARRCLNCANCTLVCPTCFCTAVEDSTDLTGAHAERTRKWDSCFTVGFSYIHGGSVRPSASGRYRQWLTHKFASWIDQFGSAGCAGCGRCITWCPVGIDVTEELRALTAGAGASKGRATAAKTNGAGERNGKKPRRNGAASIALERKPHHA